MHMLARSVYVMHGGDKYTVHVTLTEIRKGGTSRHML